MGVVLAFAFLIFNSIFDFIFLMVSLVNVSDFRELKNSDLQQIDDLMNYPQDAVLNNGLTVSQEQAILQNEASSARRGMILRYVFIAIELVIMVALIISWIGICVPLSHGEYPLG